MLMAKEKLAAVMFIVSKAKFNILECEALAKDIGVKTFELVGPTGRISCRWLDPHYGIFERLDQPDASAMHTRQFQYVGDVHCENLEGWS